MKIYSAFNYFKILLFSTISLNCFGFQTNCTGIDWNKKIDSLRHSMDVELPEEDKLLNTLKYAEDCFNSAKDQKSALYCKVVEIDYYSRSGEAQLCIDKIKAYRFDKELDNLSKKYPEIAADVCYVWAFAKQELGELDTAAILFDLSIKYFQEAKDFEGYADACLSAAELSYRNNDYFYKTKKYFRMAEEAAAKHLPPDDYIYRYLYQVASAIFYEEAELEKAIEYGEKGLNKELNFKKPSREMLGIYYSQLSSFHSEELDNNQALIYALASLPYYEDANIYHRIELQSNIYNIYFQLDRKKEAMQHFNACKELITKAGWKPQEEKNAGQYSYKAMSSYFLNDKKPDSLIAYLMPILPDIEKYNLNVVDAFQFLGNAYEMKEDFKKAEFYYKKNIEEKRKKYGNDVGSLANNFLFLIDLYARNKNWDACLVTLDSVFHLLAVPKNNNDIKFEEIGHHKTLINAFALRGNAYLAKGMYREAQRDYETSIGLLNYLSKNYSSDASKKFSLEKLRPIYESAALATYHLQLNENEKAGKSKWSELIFSYAENSKASLLNENLLKYNPNYQKSIGIPESEFYEQEKITARIDELRELIHSAQQKNDDSQVTAYQKEILQEQRKLETFDNNLRKKYPDYKSKKELFKQSVTLNQVKKSLTADELVLEYFIADSLAYVFFISKDSTDLKIIENHSLFEFRNNIILLRKLLTDLDYCRANPLVSFESFQQIAHEIFKQYVDHPFLKEKSNLIIVPDREFNYIPFEILLSSSSNFKNQAYDSLPYLIKTHNIRYEYSSTIMVNNGRKNKISGNGRVAGFAPNYQKNFKYDSIAQDAKLIRTPKELQLHQNLNNLEGAKKEIQLLKNSTKGDFFIGLDASEKNFKKLNKKAFSVLHLAMHGIVDTDKPGLSSLVFTENLDRQEDNLLYSYEINSLDFSKVELVVLSACQTGFGKYELGEGVVSIGRSFMQAGVSSLVSTLWELNDNSTMEIMKLFYQNLAKGLPKDQALRKAKLQYIQTHPGIGAHPFLWAGLVQYGDSSPIKMKGSSFVEIIIFSLLGVTAILIAALWFYRRKKWKSQHV